MTPVELSGCVIVSGMPGAGKSTVCELAARFLRRAALVKGDDVNVMIRSGAVSFAGEPRDEAARQVELCKRNMCALANNFVDYGYPVFMDTVVQDRATLDQLLALLSPRPCASSPSRRAWTFVGSATRHVTRLNSSHSMAMSNSTST